MPEHAKNRLYYGDNLAVIREHIPDRSVDLICLNRPFSFLFANVPGML